jgi:hypothetical protein
MIRTLAYIGASEAECRAAMARTTVVLDGERLRQVVRLLDQPRIDRTNGRCRIEQEAILR